MLTKYFQRPKPKSSTASLCPFLLLSFLLRLPNMVAIASSAAILLLLLLFIAGFLNIYFDVPSKKLCSWLHSFLLKNPSASAKVSPQKEGTRTATSCNNSAKGELKSVFATFDKNGDGFITKQELRESLKNIGIFITAKEVEEMVVKFDSNGDGLIDYEEFCLLCDYSKAGGDQELGDDDSGGGKGRAEEEGDLKEAFDVFDKDKNGLITVEELGLVLCSLGLKEGKRVEDCKEMIRKVDMDGDGMVNFDEFKRMMQSGSIKLIPVC
ncbi:hypothetical protein P3X46_022781 [Hevea brasiliensis]|uniref:EF-hand domain-containing protein n=1 Tax=Hevea brasiliensis TaxID=3981 RepID=A0ABQ9LAL2_HEVBR|nr:calmodulin-like protein 3 [Hevea brasiliensis]XP_021689974.2 calmodulin-like protein 3 [Hevea brasiliensis]KAJ9163067.1 hypothetical protein P3X46_022781 [Hevea brasiliensis]